MNAFDRLCGSAIGPVGIAVSGGGDSLALLLLAQKWARAKGRHLIAFTVDHRLRPEAAEEAAGVAALCGRLHIPHQTLVWNRPAGKQAAARRARHALMATELKARGGTHLMLGHTEDDQCETFLMRARQGSTWYGLAGMQPVSLSPVWPEGQGILLARPVLGYSREALRHVLLEAGQYWVDDPSNANPVYERVRVRALLARHPRLKRGILASQARLQQLRRLEERAMGRWIEHNVKANAEAGRFEISLGGLPLERAERLISLLIQIIAGREVPPRRDGVQPLVAHLISEHRFEGATLGGALIYRKSGLIQLSAEPAVTGPEADFGRAEARLGAIMALYCGQT
ncbi:tRNA lysidine(34) synthetase TilS [Hyphomonas pacifica]|uniref:tRNA(Ile)-lysidine synthase n=1 Tax=Hyphomonas pacifica TaxID=1280941 RepID=A0A062U380_9PROT|nr:tRNA lysidine(34) synthetase TilS [Hyphomonas pacifica]KCZ51089.1 hypothetical protein HY2_12675 [Hyphomonas pacifica]RAN35443.1 hypothetical protein HY3_07840 [Hyphomonas pacifica]